MFRSGHFDVVQPEVALVAAAVVYVLILICAVLQDPVCMMLVCDDLSMFMESVPRSIHRVQPDVRALSGLQLGVMQCFVACLLYTSDAADE